MSVIEVKGLNKNFKDHRVIDDLSFKIEEGDFFGLVGRNGAGKSTLINILTGIYCIDEGTIKIMNQDYDSLDQVKMEIGVMPDTSMLYSDMNAYEFMRFMATLKGIKLERKDIEHVLNCVGLCVDKHLKIKNYSFGMKKKICIAQALIGKPKLLFLDEPTSGVDPESILKLQELFRELNKAGVTIFITSHNLYEIEKLCNKVAFLKDGKFSVYGELEEITRKYDRKTLVIETCQEDSSNIKKILGEEEYKLNGNKLELGYKNEDEIARIVKKLVENDIKVYSVIPQKPSLEEIFLE